MLELPAALSILLVGLLVPLLTLATIGIRVSFLNAAAQEAAHAASRANVFENSNPQPGDLPDAKTVARNQAQATVQALGGGGIAIDSGSGVNTTILISKITNPNPFEQPTGGVTASDHMLRSVDIANNVYSVRVTVTAKIDPIFKFPRIFGDIPGLTGPFAVSAVGQEMVEHPQSLQQRGGVGGG